MRVFNTHVETKGRQVGMKVRSLSICRLSKRNEVFLLLLYSGQPKGTCLYQIVGR